MSQSLNEYTGKYFALLYSDRLSISNQEVKDFYYYGITYNSFQDSIIKDSIAFPYYVDDYHHSLVHLLYNQSLIKQLMYAIVPVSSTEGFMYYGEIPKTLLKDKNYKGKCNIINNRWGCKMKNIIFEYQGRRYEFNNRNREIIFQSNEFSIHCPKEFLTFMLEKLNTLSTITDICKPYNSSTIEFITCSPYLFTEPSNITFHIGDYLFELKMNQIFSCYIDGCFSLFHYDREKKDNEEIWVIGADFMLKYITIFDYQDKSISFYGNNTITLETNLENGRKQILIVVTMILMVPIIFLIAIQLKKLKSNE